VIIISYLSVKLKSDEKKYKCYTEIKQWIRNAFLDVKVDYSKNDKLVFSVPYNKNQYIIYEGRFGTYFSIVSDERILFRINLDYKNNKKIIEEIQNSYPLDLDISCVRLNAKLHNRFSGKKFSETELLNLACWTQKEKKNQIRVSDDYVYNGDSSAEIKIVKHIITHGCAKILRGQDYFIEYDNRKYYPDIIYLNHLNQIVVLEVKAKGGFSTEGNIRKYIALAEHCREKGFVFGMIDRDFNTYHSYINLHVLKGFEQDVLNILKKNGVFNSQSLTKLHNEKYSHLKYKELRKMITKIVLDHRLVDRPKTVHDLNIINENIKYKNYDALFRNQ